MKAKLPLPLLAAISALPPLSIDMYLPAIPGMAASLGTEISVIQNSLSVFFLALALGMLVFGPFADRYGRRPLVLLGLGGFALSSFFLSISPNAELFLGCRFLQGLLGGGAIVAVPAMIRDCYGKDTARGLSSVAVIMLVAPLIAPLIGSFLLGIGDWRTIFLVLALYALISLLFSVRNLPETLPPAAAPPKMNFLGNYLGFFANRVIYPDLATFMLSSMAFFTYLTSAPFIYITYFGASETHFGLLFAGGAGMLILANVLNMRIVSRFGPRRVMHWGLLGGLIFSIALVLASSSGLNLYWFVACNVLIVGSLGLISVNADALILIAFPKQAGSASAAIRTLRFSVGSLVGPLLALIHNGTPVPIAAMIFLILLAAALVQLLSGKVTAQAAAKSAADSEA